MTSAYVRGEQARLEPEAVTTTFRHVLAPHDRPSMLTSTGRCPRCRHATEQTDPLYRISNFNEAAIGAYVDAVRTMLRNEVLEEIRSFRQTMRCACDFDHDGRKENERGCGAVWNLEVNW